MSWWGWWKTESKQDPVEEQRKSTTAMLDDVIAKVKAENEAGGDAVKIASRRATNASRRVIGRTGMHLQAPSLPNKQDFEPDTK